MKKNGDFYAIQNNNNVKKLVIKIAYYQLLVLQVTLNVIKLKKIWQFKV